MKSILDVITPINIAEEKAKFFSSRSYNPVFIYCWEADSSLVSQTPKYQALVSAIISQNHQEIVRAAKHIFQVEMQDKTLKVAQRIVDQKRQLLPSQDISSVIHAFKEAFAYFHLEYHLEVSDAHGFNFRPSPSQKKLVFSQHANFQLFSLDGEVKHELTHILRYENGKYNQIKRSQYYLPSEEGLASYMQDYQSTGPNESLFQHAAEYLATAVSLKADFRAVFDFLVSIGFGEDLAWQRGIRHKFGFKDTSKPGDIMKPAMYFYNEQLIKDYSTKDKLKLFVGKISSKDLPTVLSYKGLIPEEKIMYFINLA